MNEPQKHFLPLERDKYYQLRNGGRVRVVCTDVPGDFPVIVAYDSGKIGTRTLSGAYLQDYKDGALDIIAPWIERPTFDRSLLAGLFVCATMNQDKTWYASTRDAVPGKFFWETIGYTVPIPNEIAPKFDGDWRESKITF